MLKRKFYLKLLMSLLLTALVVPQGHADELTVANTTSTDLYVPLYGSWMDAAGTYSQTIYTSSQLESLQGKQITAITYYANAALSTNFSGAVIQVSMKEVSESSYSSATPITGMEVCGETTLAGGETNVKIDLETPFTYSGDNNLAVEIRVKTGAGYATVNWYAMTTSGSEYCSIYYYNGDTNRSYKIPMTTFTYESGEVLDYAAKVSPSSLDFGSLLVDATDTKSVTIQNKGALELPYTITGLNAPFSTTSTSGSIATGSDIAVPVTFAPIATGSFEGDMLISFPGSGLNDVTVHVTGSASDAICNGTDESAYLPIYGYCYDYTQKNQMIYPASMLTKYLGKNITALKFYTKDGVKYTDGSYNVSLGTTTQSTFASATPASATLTMVKSDLTATDGVSGNELTITFDEPFLYEGDNLVVDFEVVTKGTCDPYSSRTNFIGANQSSNTAYYSYVTYGTNKVSAMQQFLPKIDITAEETGPVPTITVDPATVEEFTTEVDNPVTATVNVTGENLTGDITATISGTNADYFSTTMNGSELTITYNPAEAGEHTATLTLSSEGARNVTIELSGTATAPAVPTIIVNPATLTINAALGETKTASFTVTGTNLEGGITVAPSEGFSVDPTTIAAADAAAGATVTVTYVAPATAETKTGTITLTSENAETKTVAITATAADITYDFTVEPESLDFGEVYVGQSNILAVTIKNNGNDNINPVFTFNNNVFTVEDDSYPVYGGLSQQYNIIYTPVAAGTDNGTVQITIGSQTVTVSLTGKGKELAAYDIASSAASGVHNFGDAFVDGTASWSFTITNNGKNAVTPTIEGLAEPFSTTYESAAIASGESATITINFKPTAIQAYGPTSIVVKFNETEDFQFDYTLRGNGIEDTGTLPPSTYDNYSYTWTDDNGDEHTSAYSEIANDPNQMIALLKAIYTDKNMPGNYYRGYTATGVKDTQHEVAYPAIGAIARNYDPVTRVYTHEFADAYGWGMAHDETNYPITHSDPRVSGSYTITDYILNPNEYKPNQEGLTLLLVEMNDGVGASTTTTKPTDYASLKNLYSKMFKSVRVIPNSKRVTKNGVEGTLFKVDCDKMNRFFFLAKGRLRWYAGETGSSAYFRDQVKSSGSGSSYTWNDRENSIATVNPFNVMYEQFSPVSLSSGQASSDVYQELIGMNTYDVEHDCESIPWASANGVSGHEFNMYGKESISADCQDVRDLMFFVPDERMLYWDGRDQGTADMFVNYYKQNAPNMAMYVIHQNEITGERNGEAEQYTLNLSWESNLTDFVPGENGEYTIYLVNDDGTYTPVAEHIPSSQTTYTLTVDMQQHGQQVTYVIQGQDNTGFLSLQYSNEQSFIIPGLDPTEKFQLVANAAYYSRYNPADEHNYYANGMQVMAYPDVNASDYAGKTFNFYRKAAGENDWTLVATASVNNEGTGATVSMVETTQRLESDYKFGYKQNPATIAMTADAKANKKFDVIYDNFKADVSANDHATSYSYKMETADGAYHSNELTIKVFKTAMSNITGSFDWAYVEGDDVRQVADKGTQFDVDVQLSSKTEILRYGTYRWDSSFGTETNPYAVLNLNSSADDEEDISPAGQASNQGEYYSVYMNGDSYKGDDVYVAQGETGKATFVDNVPETAVDEYTYVPVVETFTGRSDYNTYGAPMQETATGELDITVGEKKQSGDITWTADGKTYTYYNVCLNVNKLQIPQGYEVAMLRAWRQIDESYLGEQKGKGYENRAVLDANGDFLFLKDAENGFGEVIGDEILVNQEGQYGNIFSGTFGAVKLENGQTIPMKFTVRVYFTKSESTSNAPRLKAEGESKKYYITEIERNDELTSDIPTSIFGVVTSKAVADVKYYNIAGVESDRPFQGVNIEVTRYTDGSKSTRKILK
ncbi:MAG: choice-of-anchor D domain-containing protein [Bacteroidales bacterium]|nr:choice-of-anchor D domain-containing protein [Bacteroidales bacterium]